MWLQIARAARQEHTIDLVDELIDRERLREHGNDERDRVRGLNNGFEILLARHVKRVGFENPPVGRHANNRFPTHSDLRIRLPAAQPQHYIQNDPTDQ
jgi:hypothetical protein